jgi:hypothetical protein
MELQDAADSAAAGGAARGGVSWRLLSWGSTRADRRS